MTQLGKEYRRTVGRHRKDRLEREKTKAGGNYSGSSIVAIVVV